MGKFSLLIFLTLLFTSIWAQEGKRETAETVFEKGIKLQNERDHEGAIRQFSRCLYLDAAYVEAYVARASSKEQLNDLAGALTDLNSSLEFQPDQFEVLLSRGALLFRMAKYKAAKTDFLKLLTIPTGETNSVFYRRSAHRPGTDMIMTAQSGLRSQVYNYLGLIEVQLNNCKQGILFLDSALRLNNTDADYFVNRALAKQTCQDQSAVEDYQSALKLNPDHAIARHNIAVESARRGSFDEAELQLTEAIERDSALSYPYIERGYYRLMRGNYQGALHDYNRALQLNPSDAEVWLNRGIVKEKLGDLTGAYSDYTESIDRKEDFVKAWLNRGNIFMKQAEYRDAIEEYTTAITFQPDYGQAYYNRSIAYFRIKSGKEACADLKEAIRLGITVEQKMVSTICVEPD